MAAQITNGGANQIMGAVLGATGAAASAQISYIAVGTGAGLLATGLANGSPYTALNLQSGCATAMASGASITLMYGSNSQVVTLSSAAAQGDTTLHVTSFNANYAYPVNSGIVTTPSATDTQLQNEIYRAAISGANVGTNPGEGLFVLYIAPTSFASTTVLEIGWFAGSASTTANSGVLIARATYWYPHVYGADSASTQLDMTL